MSARVRFYVVMAIMALLAFAYSRLAGGLGDLVFFAIGAGLAAVICLAGMSWIEMAADGAFRHKSRT
jgi:hypothetical protein